MIAILLSLGLIGAGFILYLLLVGATHALPILVGFAAGILAADAGLSVPLSILIGGAAFMLVISAGRCAALSLPAPGRMAVALAFALPAGIAGYSVGRLLAATMGLTDHATFAAFMLAALSASIAAQRVVRPA